MVLFNVFKNSKVKENRHGEESQGGYMVSLSQMWY